MLCVWQLLDRKLFSLDFLRVLLLPLLLAFGGIFLLVFLEGILVRHVIAFGIGFLLWLYLQVIFLRFHAHDRYQQHALENISSYINVVTAFLFFSSLLSVQVFLSPVSFWELAILAGLVSMALLYQQFWASEIKPRVHWRYIAILGMFFFEVFVAVSFLPTSVFVSGILLTVCYYSSSGIIRNWLHGIQEMRVIRRYVVLSLLTLAVVLLSAKWI
jgi:hypothetical protein